VTWQAVSIKDAARHATGAVVPWPFLSEAACCVALASGRGEETALNRAKKRLLLRYVVNAPSTAHVFRAFFQKR